MTSPLAHLWKLQPGLTYVNHGSFGACPTVVLEYQAELRGRMEADAVRFLDTELPARLGEVRESVGAFIGANGGDLVFLSNSTAGANAVLRSLERTLQPGDELLTTSHEYNAMINALQFVAASRGARVVVAGVPFPIHSADQVVDAVMERVTPRTKLALFSWVTSATAVIFPAERLTAALAERGVEVLIDGAHAPGMVPIDVAALERAGASYLVGNGHKWMCSPKGASFLWVRRDRQHLIHPLVISHGTNAPLSPGGRSRFQLEFDWPGTPDPTAVLALPTAIDYLASLVPGGWPALMAANHELVLQGRQIVADAIDPAWRQSPLVPDEMLGSMVTIQLPADLEPLSAKADPDADPDATLQDDPLHRALRQDDRVQVPVFAWPARPALGAANRYMRISAQRYNDLDDYHTVASALARRARQTAVA